jgi:PAS domain S-box-containing protein
MKRSGKNKEKSVRRTANHLLYSIKTQLVVAMLAATLIPLTIATFFNIRTIGNEAKAAGLQALQGAAQQTAQGLDAFIEMGLYHGTASAALPELHRFFQTPEQTDMGSLVKTLGSIQDQNPVFIQYVTLFDPQGRELASSSPQGMDRDHELLNEILNAALETGRSVLSPVHFDDHQAFLCFYSPIMENGNPVGLLRISYSASILQQLVTRYTGLIGEASFPTLLNEDCLQIAHGVLPHGSPSDLYVIYPRPDKNIDSLVRSHRVPPGVKRSEQSDPLCAYNDRPHQTGSPSATGPLDTKHRPLICAAATLQNMPWLVVFFQPEEALLNAIYLGQKYAFQTGIVLALLAILAAFWLASGLTAPIALLSATARQAAQEMRPLPLHVRSRNEIGLLAESFNRLFEVLDLEQQKLIQSEENLRITLDSIGDSVITTDKEGRITGANPATEILTGKTSAELKGRLFREAVPLFDSRTRQPLPDITSEVLATGKPVAISNHATLITQDGAEKHIADSAAPIHDASGELTGCVLALSDVTEKYELEARLAHSQKMDALGQMAGGVAHDFNNMLTPILGASQLLSEDRVSDEDRKKHAAMVSSCARRAAELTQMMLTFSRKAPAMVQPVDLRKVLDDCRAMLQHSIGPRISIRTHCPLSPMITTGDASLIQNVFFNLALNARDAMPEHGTLTFTMSRQVLDAEYCRRHSYEITPGPYIQMQVADSGCGISRENLSKIFDPFFTTKPAGKGTGLGLASVYGTMKKHEGLVTVYSEQGKGTVFNLYFPESAEKPCEQEEPPPRVPDGHPCILIIDDDEGVRMITAELLKSLGYTVLAAAGGTEGIELYRNEHGKIAAILLDMVMPEPDGAEVFAALRKINPDARILLMSGFDGQEAVTRLLNSGAAGFIQKPFQTVALAKAVQEAVISGGQKH